MGTQGLEWILDALIKTYDDYCDAVSKAQARQVEEDEYLCSELEKKLQNNDALMVLEKLKKRHPIMTRKPRLVFVKAAIQKLDLSYNDITYSEPVFAKIKDAVSNSDVQDLNLSGNQISTPGFQQIGQTVGL